MQRTHRFGFDLFQLASKRLYYPYNWRIMAIVKKKRYSRNRQNMLEHAEYLETLIRTFIS